MTRKAENRQRRRLTDYDVTTIRAAVREGAPLEDLAEGYGVPGRTIREAAYGSEWDHVPGRLEAPVRRGWFRRTPVPAPKVTEDDVREIRALYPDVAVADIAGRFDLSVWTVDLICRGVLWKHVR
jgi:hypothetical protein